MIPVITMYSYKGGAGRTVCTANLAGLLAKELNATKENPILVMDMDLDSAGLSHVLEEYDSFEFSSWNTQNLINGNIHLGRDVEKDIFFNKDEKVKLTSHTIDSLLRLGLPADAMQMLGKIELRQGVVAELDKLIAERPEHLTERLQRIRDLKPSSLSEALGKVIPSVGTVDVSKKVDAPPGSVLFLGAPQVGRDLIVEGDGARNLKLFMKHCEEENVAAILIDSASGRQNSANLCHDMASVVVYCCRLTYQFRIGTKLQMRYFVSRPAKGQRKKPAIIILPVAVPKASSERWEKQKSSAITDLTTLALDMRKHTQTYCFQDGVPEVESFKWQEHILLEDTRLSDDEENARQVFKLVAAKIKDLMISKSQTN